MKDTLLKSVYPLIEYRQKSTQYMIIEEVKQEETPMEVDEPKRVIPLTISGK